MTATTPAAVRDELAARVTAIVPSLLAADRFVEVRYEAPIGAWALANPTACLRRFSVTEADDVEPPDVTDGVTEAVWQEFTVEVAYPTSWRSGPGQRVGLTDMMAADRAQIAKTIGTNGFATYSTAPSSLSVLTVAETRLDLGPVQLGIVRLRVRYFRDATP